MKIEIEDIQELIKKELSSTLDQKFKILQEKISGSQEHDYSDRILNAIRQLEQLDESVNEKANVLQEGTKSILNAFDASGKQMESLLRAISKIEHEKDMIRSCEESQRKFMKRFYTSIFVSVGLAILFSISLSCNIIWRGDLSRSEVNDIKYRFLHLRNPDNNSMSRLDSICNDRDRFNAIRKEVIEEEKYNEKLARKWEEIQRLERKTQEKKIEVDNLKQKF